MTTIVSVWITLLSCVLTILLYVQERSDYERAVALFGPLARPEPPLVEHPALFVLGVPVVVFALCMLAVIAINTQPEPEPTDDDDDDDEPFEYFYD